MNRFIQALIGRGGRLVVLFLTLTTMTVACSTTSQTGADDEGDEGDEVIGKPPSAEEDPFFVTGEPGSAEAAAPTGRIGEDEKTTASEDESSDDEQSSALQCFSCVRVCPAEGDCERAKDDVICGWGVHDDEAQASRLAKAECDAALDMARQMPVWSDIAGQCPAATCR